MKNLFSLLGEDFVLYKKQIETNHNTGRIRINGDKMVLAVMIKHCVRAISNALFFYYATILSKHFLFFL